MSTHDNDDLTPTIAAAPDTSNGVVTAAATQCTTDQYGQYKGSLYTTIGVGLILGINGVIIGIVGIQLHGAGSTLSIVGLLFFVCAIVCLAASFRIHQKMNALMKRGRCTVDHGGNAEPTHQADTSNNDISTIVESDVSPPLDYYGNCNLAYISQPPDIYNNDGNLSGLPSYEDVLKEKGGEAREEENANNLQCENRT